MKTWMNRGIWSVPVEHNVKTQHHRTNDVKALMNLNRPVKQTKHHRRILVRFLSLYSGSNPMFSHWQSKICSTDWLIDLTNPSFTSVVVSKDNQDSEKESDIDWDEPKTPDHGNSCQEISTLLLCLCCCFKWFILVSVLRLIGDQFSSRWWWLFESFFALWHQEERCARVVSIDVIFFFVLSLIDRRKENRWLSRRLCSMFFLVFFHSFGKYSLSGNLLMSRIKGLGLHDVMLEKTENFSSTLRLTKSALSLNF